MERFITKDICYFFNREKQTDQNSHSIRMKRDIKFQFLASKKENGSL